MLSKVKSNFKYLILFLLILGIGVAIRTLQFPEIPPGLNQDEADSAYETYSLLKTGRDKWGNGFPAYFPSWGSGQNVLMAYLSIPIVKIYGLNIFSTRLMPMMLGILALPLFFFFLRPLGRFPAFFGMFLLAIVPWHFMLSRWALESNLLPFFMLLGCVFLSRAVITHQKKWIIPCLIPFALALYSYGTTIIVLPVFFALFLFMHYKYLRLKWQSWLIAFVLFLIIAFPFFIFFIENYILKHDLTWVDHLFFSTPMCPSNRLDQMNSISTETLIQNLNFMISGCDDGSSYNLLARFKLLLNFILPLGIIGFIISGIKMLRQKKKKETISKPEHITISIFFAWGIASLPLFALFELNVNRFNHFFLPCLASSIWLMDLITRSSASYLIKQSLRIFIAAYFLLESISPISYYFTDYPQSRIKKEFNSGLKEAFDAVNKLPVNQIRITDQIPLPYVYTLFYLSYPPEKFQEEAYYETLNDYYKVSYFGKFIFSDEYLDITKEYGYLARKSEVSNDDERNKKIIYENDYWEVGIVK